MRKLTFLLTCLFLVGVGLVNAQSRSITGNVFSADDGQPVIGATVMVKGTTVGTITDTDGKFKISVPGNAKSLVVSYVGMKTIEVEAKSNQTIRLEVDSRQMDEVVVTAFGITKSKKSLGYASQEVKSSELTQAANSDLATALQGKLSGVEIAPSSGMPGASSKITIRGSRSFTGDNTPLYVVDGMPISSTADFEVNGYGTSGTDYSNRAIDIDPNDIESVNILKGQAASALYGMRASNGVVIITTKKGANARSSKPEVSVNSNVAFSVISAFPDLQTEFAQGTSGAYNPASSTSWGPLISELPNSSKYGGNTSNTYTNNGASLHPGQYYVVQRANAGLDPWATPQVYNSAKNFFQTGSVWNNSVNVSQSVGKGNYSVTLGSSNSKGIVPSTGMDRYNAKIAAETKLTDKWSSGFSGNIISSHISKQSSGNNGIVATVYPCPPSYDLAGIPSSYAGNPYKQNTYRSTSGFDAAYWAINNNKFTEDLQRFFGNAFIKYSSKISDNQKIEVKYQIGDDEYNTNYTDLFGFGHANSGGSIQNYAYAVNELNSLATVTYNWKVNEDVNIDALVGNEIVDKTTRYTFAQGTNFNYGGFNHIDNTSAFLATSSENSFRSFGTFGNLSADYKNMLYLNATLRNDIISSMPRGNRTFTYPSFSLGWVFTELSSLNSVKSDVLTYGKLRASYANVGQAGTYYNTYYNTPVYGGGFSSGTPITYPIGSVSAYTLNTTVYDPKLKPQNTTNYEVGTDLIFFNGLISLNYTYSRQNVKDQIFSVPLSGSTGASYLVTNGGSIHTNSHEITLGLKPVTKKNVKWDLTFNFTKIDNYVDALATGVNSIFLGGFTEPQVRAGIGYKYPVIYGVSYLRNDAGQIVVDANGLPQAGPEKVIGTVSPKFILGFNTSLEIFKFKLSAVFDWKNGGQMYSGTENLLDFYGISQNSANIRKQSTFLFGLPAVKVTGTDANGKTTYATNDITIKGSDAQNYFTVVNGISEASIYDASFVKLREVSLSYPIFSKSWLSVNLNVFARNIILWSALKGLDPETSQGNTNMSGAFERFSLPGTSTYGFGLNVKF